MYVTICLNNDFSFIPEELVTIYCFFRKLFVVPNKTWRHTGIPLAKSDNNVTNNNEHDDDHDLPF